MTDNSSLKRWYLVNKRVGCSLSPYFFICWSVIDLSVTRRRQSTGTTYFELELTAITYLILMLLNFNCNYLLWIDITYLEI